MGSVFLPVILATLVVAAGSALDPSINTPTSDDLHSGAASYDSNRRLIPRQQIVHDNGKQPSLPDNGRAKQPFASRLTPNKTDTVSLSRNAPNTSGGDAASNGDTEGERDSRASRQAISEEDGMLMAGAERRKNKSKRGDKDDDDEDKKTLSQQIVEGKYGLIEKEIYATTPKRPGIISYDSNPEVPRDTAQNLGGLEPEEIWLSENHVLVLRGGYFPEHKFNRTDDTATAWPPIDNFNAPPRQVKIPANPKVPPPFPVQLTDGGPTQFIGFNGTAGPPPFPPFFPQPPPGNGSYFAPPFPFQPPGSFTPGFYPPVPPGNFTPGGGLYPPPGNGSFSPPLFPYPLPPPRNGSYFGPPPGNFTPGSGPLYPPPFPGFPPLPYNETFPPYPLPPGIYSPAFPPNGTLPFPPPFPNLPPGAAFLPPPENFTEPFDEDDPSLYYPPPYDFFYPQDNSSEVPPGPLVPGIILPPPPNFFAPLNNQSDEDGKHNIKPPPPLPPSTEAPATDTPKPPYGTYLPGLSRPPVTKERRPPLGYLPVTNEVRRKKPRPTVSIVDNEALNHVTPVPEIDVLTPAPEIQNLDRYSEKPPRPSINVVPQNVQVTHQGQSPIEITPQQGYYYENPTIVFTPAPETVYNNDYSKVQNNAILTTDVPAVSYYTVPLTDISVQPTPKLQHSGNVSDQYTPVQPTKTHYQHEHKVHGEPPLNRGKELNILTTLKPLLVYYNSHQQPLDTETNTVTPPPQPYSLKTKNGDTATPSPPLVYYSVPSVGKTRNPTSVKTSFYFYEEPNAGLSHVSDVASVTTTPAPPAKYQKLTTISPGRHYSEKASPTPRPYYNAHSTGGKSDPPKVQPEQYIYSDVFPVQHSEKGITQTEQAQDYIYSDAIPVEIPDKNSQTVHSKAYSDVLPISAQVKGSKQSQQYSDVVPAGQVKGVRQRTRPQSYILSSALLVGEQVIFPSIRSKLPQSSTPAPPQYYYITQSPGLQYEVVGSTTPPATNQNYPIQPPQQEHVKLTAQQLPLVSKLAYFTTPRPNFAYNDVSSETPIFYNIQPSPSPRPTYQYGYEKSGNNPETQQPRQQNIYTTTRTKSRTSQKMNYQGHNEGAVVSPVQYQSTPRTLFEYSYEQSTKAPAIQQFYPAVAPQYEGLEEVTARSPATHYGYEDSRGKNLQGHGYQSTSQQKFSGHQHPQVNIHPTANPLHAYFTRQDERLLDDITKKYFTIFGQKLPSGGENVPTTPIPPYDGGNVQSQSKRPYVLNGERQYYTTPIPNYNIQNSDNLHENDHGSKVPVSLAADININYKKPLPPVNPISEFIDTRQISNLETGRALVSYKFPGDGGHFYFITPQVVGVQESQQQVYSLPSQGPHQLVTYRRKKRKQQR